MNSLPYPGYRIEEIWRQGRSLVWEEIKELHQEQLKYLIENAILSELESFIGCGKYERSRKRKSYRNGSYERAIATTLGELLIRFPRLRYESFQSQFIKKYSRRMQEVDYAVLNCFVLGGSVRKTKRICDLFIDVQISPGTVSNINKTLDENAKKFHLKKINKKYRFLILDGLWIKVQDKYKKKKVILFAMGITANGEKEVIDFMQADGESEEAYSNFINHLIKRGLDTEALELIIHDGHGGLRAALDICLPYSQKQYCIFHKIQGIAQKLKHKHNRKAIMRDAGDIYKKAHSKEEVFNRLKKFRFKWRRKEPWAVRYFTLNFDKTLAYFNFPASIRSVICTSNHLERFLREIRRRTKPMGNFKNDKSVNRIIYSLVYSLNTGTVPYEFTQHS
ncbi:MAG: IS256 family transposase [Patescibacteria group bacterium]